VTDGVSFLCSIAYMKPESSILILSSTRGTRAGRGSQQGGAWLNVGTATIRDINSRQAPPRISEHWSLYSRVRLEEGGYTSVVFRQVGQAV
jgi:hypothetical protein